MFTKDRLPSPPASRGGDDRRRSVRVPRVVPLVLERDGSRLAVRTVVISAHGAMVTSPEPFTQGLTLSVLNEATKSRLKAWIVWSRPGDTASTYSVAIEFLESAGRFWGADYAS